MSLDIAIWTFINVQFWEEKSDINLQLQEKSHNCELKSLHYEKTESRDI